MGNIKKAMLNEQDSEQWNLPSIDEANDFIQTQLMKVASESVRETLINGDHDAYLGLNSKLGDGITLSVCIGGYSLYFNADDLLDLELSHRTEIEAMSKWFKESHYRMEKALSETE